MTSPVLPPEVVGLILDQWGKLCTTDTYYLIGLLVLRDVGRVWRMEADRLLTWELLSVEHDYYDLLDIGEHLVCGPIADLAADQLAEFHGTRQYYQDMWVEKQQVTRPRWWLPYLAGESQ